MPEHLDAQIQLGWADADDTPFSTNTTRWTLLGAMEHAQTSQWLRVVEDASLTLANPSRLSSTSQRVLDQTTRASQTAYGAGSRMVLLDAFQWILTWAEKAYDPSKGTFDVFTLALWRDLCRAHEAQFTRIKLRCELEDERERDAAAQYGRDALVFYTDKWRRRLEQLQRLRTSSWTIPNMTAEESIDQLELRLLEAVVRHERFQSHARPGCEWGFLFLAAEKDSLRRVGKVFAVNARTPHLCDLLGDAPLSAEEMLISVEDQRARERALREFESSLSRPQKKWLAAFRLAFGQGDTFATSGKLNLAHVARSLGKDRSSAQRAQKELKALFDRALARHGL